MRKKNDISRNGDIRKSIFLSPKLFEELSRIQIEEDTYFLDVISYILGLGLAKYYEGVEHLRKDNRGIVYDENSYLYEDE